MNTGLKVYILCLLLVPGILFAGTAGKIRGKLTLKDTHEPAVGANVLVDGTTYGASTDADGNYLILNIPAGSYTVKASFVGYHAPPVINLKVTADLTTELNFELVPQDVELPAVQIVAERPLVNKSATNAVRVLGREDLQGLPVRGLTSVFALQPGVVLQDNNVYIRGGRSDEVGFYVEGASSRNILNGGNAVTIIPEAVEEFQIQAGGYNAEYGGANAGIIRQQLRSGTSKYKASYSVESDKFTSESNRSLNTYSYGYWNHVLTLSGPVVGDHLKFFFAGENQFQRDRTPSLWNGFEFPNAQFPSPLIDGPGGGREGDTLFAGSGVPASSIDPRYGTVKIPNGLIPSNFINRYTANGTVILDNNPYIVRFGVALTWQRRGDNSLPVQNILDQSRLPIRENSSGLYNLKFTHLVTPKTFYEINLNYFNFRDKRYDPDFQDNIMAYGDSVENAKLGYTYFNYMNGQLSPNEYRFYGFPFARPGELIVGGSSITGLGVGTNYFKLKQSYVGGSLDFTTQANQHEIKVGGSYNRYTVRFYSVGRLENVFSTFITKPDSARDPDARVRTMRSAAIPNNYGYDVFGNETDGGFDGPKNPKFGALYLQDKVELNDLIINAGVRYDYFDTDDREFIDATNPGFVNGDIFNLDPSTLRQKDAFSAVSPRLGLSFPVSDRTVFHMQYGKFIQSPELNDIYLGSPQLSLYVSGRNFIPTPVGLGLDPERTTQYEVGFTQQITNFSSFDITGFYKDIKGQIQVSKITTQSGALARSYDILQNGDFATTKGLEFTLTLRRTNRVQAKINYTLSDAQGTGSNTTSGISSVENASQIPTVISPLSFNQTHRGSINVDYHFAQDDGGPILERLGANILFTFNSGHNYTKVAGGLGQTGPEDGGILYDGDPRNRRPLEAINASTTPWNFNIDLRIDKTFTIPDLFEVNAYIYVQNLFDTKNVINVYGRTGNAEDDGFLSNPDLSDQIVNGAGRGDAYVAMYQAANLGLRQHYWRNQGGDLFGVPRQIRFGVRLEY
ncbi:MAG: carboxypeptidase-like regulatory domain-containing protein [Ignavibacteriae bacterium]|nr:carboxypeptidase-like regulatory domain-containing protein [Ignavibacteria bacterium]MBI3364158.1 carboxypeptidase-like regulatory domain-containing protein [Ignavibacteriota bacterium]